MRSLFDFFFQFLVAQIRKAITEAEAGNTMAFATGRVINCFYTYLRIPFFFGLRAFDCLKSICCTGCTKERKRASSSIPRRQACDIWGGPGRQYNCSGGGQIQAYASVIGGLKERRGHCRWRLGRLRIWVWMCLPWTGFDWMVLRRTTQAYRILVREPRCLLWQCLLQPWASSC